MAVTIEHAYDTPVGVVVFQPYTVTGGKASASGDPVIGELTDGELSVSLDEDTIYAVTERLYMRSTKDYVVVTGDAGADLADLSRYGTVADATLAVLLATGGAQGPQGPAGPGVPAGGTTGQVLAKASDDDFDTEWVSLES